MITKKLMAALLAVAMTLTVPVAAFASGGFAPQEEALFREDGGDADADPEVLAVVELTNARRAAAGAGDLRLDADLAAMARQRAGEIAGGMTHTRADGQSASVWVLAQTSFSAAGENIAMGYAAPDNVVGAWMDSTGHRANILNAGYTHIGVGCYRDVSGVTYWVQLFAA